MTIPANICTLTKIDLSLKKNYGTDIMLNVTAAIMFDGDRVFVARRCKGEFAGMWEFPGGKIMDGETPEQCLAREMMEEFDIQVQVGSFFAESMYRTSEGMIKLMAYRVKWTGGDITPNVHQEISWVKVNELKHFDILPADQFFVKKLQEK